MTVPVMPHERDALATYELTRLRRELKPFKLHWFPTLGSTNAHAARMRREGRLLAPALVLTSRQTAGRGRGSNVWHSPRGVVTASFVLSAHDTLPPQHVPLVAGLAVRNAIEEAGIASVGIKWPNDLWHDDRKVAGLLCERFGSIDVIGLGLNANLDLRSLPKTLRATTASLHVLSGRAVDQTGLLVAIAGSLRRAFSDSRTSLASLREDWEAHDVLRGRRVRVVREDLPPLEGIASGIDPGGRLLVGLRGGKMEAVLNGTARPC